MGELSPMSDNRTETRQERREKKLKKKRERMPQHGRNLARIYGGHFEEVKTAARNLAFEKAALLRDRIIELRKGEDYTQVHTEYHRYYQR